MDDEKLLIPIQNKKATISEIVQPLFDIRGAAFESFKFFGRYVDERTYEVGMKEELDSKGYSVHRQKWFRVFYKGKETEDTRRMDLVIETNECGTIICEVKRLKTFGDKERSQLFSYLRLLNCQLGILINFSPDTGVFSEVWKMNLQDYSMKRMVAK